MKKNTPILYALVLVVGDFFALVSAFVVAYILRVKIDERPLIEQIDAETFFYAFLTILPLWILVHAFIGLYRREIYENKFKEFGRLIVGSTLGMLVIIGYDFVIDDTIFPARLVAVYGFLLSFGFLLIFRIIARLARSLLFKFGIGITNVLIVGDEENATTLIEELENISRSGSKIIGIVTNKKSDYRTFETFQDAVHSLEKKNIHSIIQVHLFNKVEMNNEIITHAQTNHISYKFIPGNNELFVGNIEVELYRGTPVVSVHQTALIGWGSLVKRTFDILSSVLFIILLSPIFLIISIIQKIIEPKSSILFKQTRLTQYNREFTAYKFRSMKPGLNTQTQEEAFKKMGREDLLEEYRKGNDKLKNDPRITKFGKFLRDTSIDELPQLFNVLKGDISLVGPRALIPTELNTYRQKHNILSVKAGVTGLAQVSGRKDIEFEERRKLDLYYVQNWSFWLDVSILLRTLRAVINGIGAK